MTFIDLPITGHKQLAHMSTPQRPQSELEDAFKDVLALPMIVAVRWRQYTPYFNDGDACVFSVEEPYVAFSDGDPNGGDYGDGFYGSYDDTYTAVFGGQKWDKLLRRSVFVNSLNPDASVVVYKLNQAISGGAHDAVLAALFGDHAIVTVNSAGFVIDGYYHD